MWLPASISEVDHFLHQCMHFFIPGTVWFVLYAGFQIPQYVGKTFLMICPIVVEGDIMVMDKDPLIVFCNRTLYSFVSLFLAGKVQGFSVRCCTDICRQLFPFSLAFVQSVCITGESSISA